MPPRAKKPSDNKYNKYTDACPKMTRRWKREVVWELTTWLSLHAERNERALKAAQESLNKCPAGVIGEAVDYYKLRGKILKELTAQLLDKWDDYLWWAVADHVEATLSVGPNKWTHTPTLPLDQETPLKPKG